MKLKKYFFLMAVLCLSLNSNAQRNCGAMDYLQLQIEQNPQRQQMLDQIEQHTQQFIERRQGTERAIITIPVVVHVVYNNSTENISDAQIQSQLQVLNEDFRRLNADASNTPPVFAGVASDVEIEFCLASIDPNGNATSGITRTSTSTTAFGTNDQVKFNSSGGKDAWPAGEYMNIWVCDISGGILGYAQFPGGPANTDGIVIDYQYFGTIGTATAPFDLGRTATHEVGHYLNLRHIWGDGNCNADDFVSDTPTAGGPNYTGSPCTFPGPNSCSDGAGDQPDMFQNYMDYSDDGCMNLFTNGQKSRMNALFGAGGFRASLANSTKCGQAPPPTCNDGILNGNETGVDCGGPDCAPCQTGCNDNEVVITITLDNYPEETSWQITNSGGSLIASGGTYGSQPDGSTVTITECLVDGCYDFTINDAYGDGICCAYGNGSYSVTSGGSTLASGGAFSSSEITNFCLGGGPVPTCNDGIQNGQETGVDCGGPACPACPSCSDGIQNGNETGIDCGGPDCAPCDPGGSNVVFGHFFETGWDGWQDGGSDCARYSGSRSYEGSYSIRIRDNSGTASSMTSGTYNISSFDQVELEFYFYSYSMENGEDFLVRYDDGSGWQTVATYAQGTSFNNNIYYVATVTLDGSQYNLSSNAQFRFQCDASGNNDHIYIDAVTLTGINNARIAGSSFTAKPIKSVSFRGPQDIGEEDFKLSPNPAFDNINVTAREEIKTLNIYSITGQLLRSMRPGMSTIDVDISELTSGLYLMSIETSEEVSTQRFIKE
jgi:hypothetical protein